MKVLQISSFYAVNSLYKNLFNELKKIGIDNDIYIPCRPKNIPEVIKENEFYSGVYKNGDNIYEKFINIISQYEFYKKHNNIYIDLKKILDLSKYNLIHAHSLFENGYLAYKAKKEYEIDYIVAIRNTDVNGYLKNAKHLRELGIEIMKNAKKIVFISPSYKDYVINSFVNTSCKDEITNKSVVIPNGIDDFWVNNIINSERKLNKNAEVHLIQVSRIDKNKNIDTSIEIAKKLRENNINSFINIVGSGTEKDRLVKKYGNLNYVQFIEKANKECLKKYYDKSDILIMPSKHETFGLVYPEAMTRGLPLIYTKNQGFDKYFIEGEVGYPITFNSVEEGVRAVLRILDNYSEMSNRCIMNSKLFSWDRIAKQYKEIYYN
ncbi:MAG: glycosyltransferase family 4 protein [Clostridium sartagoforme]|nr:glycosyltransferase family 4 protein [Clostridium sartagoforme]